MMAITLNLKFYFCDSVTKNMFLPIPTNTVAVVGALRRLDRWRRRGRAG